MAQYSVDIVAKVLGGTGIDDLAKKLRGVEGAAEQSQQAVQGMSRGLGALKAAIAGLGLGLIAKGIADVGTQSQQSKTQLSALAGAYGELEVAQDSVRRIQAVLGVSAIEAREGYSQLYAALRGTGIGAQQLEILFVGLTKAARLSGAGAAEAQGALLQLKQGLASGVLAGDELRSVLETMPALTQQLAKDLGVTVGQLKKLGAEGKITSAALFNSAKAIAASAVPAMTTTESLGVAFKNLQEKIAEAFGPAIVSAMATFVSAIKVGAAAVESWREPLSSIVTNLFNFAKAMAPIAIGIGTVVGAMKAWALIQNTIRIGQAAILAMSGPGGWALIAAGVTAAAVAAAALDAGMKKVDTSMKKIKEETEKAKGEFMALLATTPGLEEGVGAAAAKAKELADAAKAAADNISASFDAATSKIQGQIGLIDQRLQLTNAQVQAEQAVNNVYLEQAQRQLEIATTADQRKAAIEAIYQLTIRNAELEYKAAMAGIKASVQKQQLEFNIVQLKLKELQVTTEVARAEGRLTEAHETALGAQHEAVSIAQQNLDLVRQIAGEQERVAMATLQSATNAATFNAQMQAAKTASSSSGGNSELDAHRRYIQQQIERPGVDSGNFLRWFNSLSGERQQAMVSGGTKRYATGGYVTGPTNALIGEGGESEYVVPESKMGEAMQRYAAGARGSGVIPGSANVNVSYSGSIVSMGGNDYISKGDVPGLLSSAVNQTLKTLQRSPDARRFAGVR